MKTIYKSITIHNNINLNYNNYEIKIKTNVKTYTQNLFIGYVKSFSLVL